MDKTSKLGLNLPEKGLRDWDVPINENFRLLDTADSLNVKLTGNQTIGGNKTFTGAVTRSHEFSGGSSKTLTDIDTNGKGSIAISPYYTGNSIYHRMYAENTTAGKHAYLDVTVNDNGNAALHFGGNSSAFNVSLGNATQVIVPTPATNDSSTKAATTANVDAKITAQAVKLTGNQTIAGSKTFSSSLTTKTGGSSMLKGVLPNNTVGTNPSSDITVYVAGVDNGGKDQSYINFVVKTDGTGQTNIVARSNSSSDRGGSGITVARKLDGTSWTSIGTTTATAPTPATSDNSTKIATTAFVNNKFQVVSALPSSPAAGVFYFIKG